MNRRSFFTKLTKCVAAAALATHLKLGDLVPNPTWVEVGAPITFEGPFYDLPELLALLDVDPTIAKKIQEIVTGQLKLGGQL